MHVGVVVADAFEECIVITAFEREVAGQHYLEHDPQGPHVMFGRKCIFA